MKKLIALILLFFLLPLSSYANKNYAEVIICEIKHADGNYQSHVFYRRNDQFLWIKGEDEILINIGLGIGKGDSDIWTCDLTEGYIRINADYRS